MIGTVLSRLAGEEISTASAIVLSGATGTVEVIGNHVESSPSEKLPKEAKK